MEFNVKDGAIAVISSNCPDKICMHYGYISKNGQTAVCLPNNVIVKIVADSKSDVDAVIR
jgi:hypothetical protein